MTDVILNLFFPFPLCVFALTIATILFSMQRRRTLAVVLTVSATLILLICGTAPLPTLLVNQLEQRHSPLWDSVDSEALAAGVRYVAVLGGSVIDNSRLPVTSRLNHTPLVRVIEAARVHRLLPGSKIITSGRGSEPTSEAETMAQLLVSIGVKRHDILTEDRSSNTHAQALEIRRIVGEARFVLVTSAIHMPRAILLFNRQGLQPIAAPTDHLVKRPLKWTLGTVVPKLGYLQLFEYALYEYLALVKARFWM